MIVLVFYGSDGPAAKARAAQARAEGRKAFVRHAEAFTGEREACDDVILLSCVSDHDAARLVAAYPSASFDAPAPADEPAEPAKRPRGRPRKVAA